jgi:hypothetical protein
MRTVSRAESGPKNKYSDDSRLGKAALENTLAEVRLAESATEAFANLRWWTRSSAAQELEAYDVEQTIAVAGAEVWRRLLEESLAARGLGDVGEAVIIDNSEAGEERLGYRREHTRVYMSQFGPVDVRRLGYGAPGASSVHPLDAELNLPRRRYSYPLQERAARLSARGPFDEAVDEIAKTTVAKLAKRQLEEVVSEAAVDFEAFYKEESSGAPSPRATGPILVVGVDCKGVPRRRTAEEKAEPPKKHLDTGEKRQKKKMATVASVHTTQPHVRTPEEVTAALMDDGAPGAGKERKPKPEHRRLWASVRQSKDEVVAEVAAEMQRRDPFQRKTAVCLMDGENALRRRAVIHLQSVFPALILVLDILHVLSYLWKAAHCFHEEGSEDARLWVRARLLSILRGNASSVAAGMRQSATKRRLSDAARGPVDIACNYFLSNTNRMKYREYLAQGLPIASGAVEGACGHLVKDRTGLTGALWDVEADRVDAVLKLRALDKSGDLDRYWGFHMRKEKERRYPDWRAVC